MSGAKQDRKPEPVPFVLVEAGRHGLSVMTANASARRAGVTEGLRFTDARSRLPDLKYDYMDREADQKALVSLGEWMLRLSPLIALDGDDGLLIETTGCDHLHAGEDGLLRAVKDALTRNGIPHQSGLASTIGAASALARGKPNEIAIYGQEAEALADLPVRLLRLSAAADATLRRFGLTRIGQLYGIDRKALARRFRSKDIADQLVLRLDQALGLRREPFTPLRIPPEYCERLQCPEPLLHTDGVRIGLERVSDRLCETLKEAGKGARVFELITSRSDGSSQRIDIKLARPSSDSCHICRLFEEQLDRVNPGFGIDLLLLEARGVHFLNVSAPVIAPEMSAMAFDVEGLSALADRLSARLGEGSVLVPVGQESHLPESSEVWVPYNGVFEESTLSALAGPRPIRLFNPPELLTVLAEVPDGPPQRFVWRKIARRVVRADGPERIAPEWWRYTAPLSAPKALQDLQASWRAPRLDPRADAAQITKAKREADEALAGEEKVMPVLPRARDYYRIEDKTGRRYWVFRQGLYEDGRGGVPQWYIHGVFA